MTTSPGHAFLFLLSVALSIREEGKRLSLASFVNNQVRDEAIKSRSGNDTITPPASITVTRTKRKARTEEDFMEKLARNVSCKLTEGDFHGAVRSVCSEETVADYSDETLLPFNKSIPLLIGIQLKNHWMQSQSSRVSALTLKLHMLWYLFHMLVSGRA